MKPKGALQAILSNAKGVVNNFKLTKDLSFNYHIIFRSTELASGGCSLIVLIEFEAFSLNNNVSLSSNRATIRIDLLNAVRCEASFLRINSFSSPRVSVKCELSWQGFSLVHKRHIIYYAPNDFLLSIVNSNAD